MHQLPLFNWKEAPFLRLIIPLIAGIIIQYYLQPPCSITWTTFAIACSLLIILARLPIRYQFRFRLLTGIAIIALVLSTGTLLSFYNDPRQHPHWFGHLTHPHDTILVTIQEPLSEKPNSWKTTATIESVISGNEWKKARGTILLYFQKDSLFQRVHYGDRLVLTKALQPVKNSGNPGAFDFKEYCGRQGIYHQAYLRHGDFTVITPSNTPRSPLHDLFSFLFHSRDHIVSTLRRYIPGAKECGLAEALLIGYKDDLDKDLVQAYSSTGVVHVIAISGLHLGIIYLLLSFLCKPFARRSATRWIKTLVIIAGLWTFSLLAGASPSILRSAIMFTCLAIGDSISRNSSIYNSLAASAFLLLAWQPAWLWDAGFQLSYTAVLSIAIFQKPIYHLFFFSHTLTDNLWKMISTTIAAQILTLPVSIFLFHQFPTLFLITNLLAIPLSSIILMGELLLCAISFIPFAAKGIGWLLHWLIWLLNNSMERTAELPFATISNISVSLAQVFILYAFIAAIGFWLLQKMKKALLVAISLLLLFTIIHSFSSWQYRHQQKMIVYHIPHHQAIDLVLDDHFYFIGDTTLQQDGRLVSNHLQPGRSLYRVKQVDSLPNLLFQAPLLQFGNKSILLIDPNHPFSPIRNDQSFMADIANVNRIPIDIIIVSNNPSISLQQLDTLFSCKLLIIDGSNSTRKTVQWEKEAARMGIPCHSTAREGAFVLNLY